jgi:hypothetical protein
MLVAISLASRESPTRAPTEAAVPAVVRPELPRLDADFLFFLELPFFDALRVRAVSTASICLSSAGCPAAMVGSLSAPLNAAEARTPLPRSMRPERKNSAFRSAGVGMGANVWKPAGGPSPEVIARVQIVAAT